MADPHFGRQTLIKYWGGQILFRETGDTIASMRRDLTGMVKRAQNLSVPFQAFQPIWFDSIANVFADGGDPVEWPALSPAYETWKSHVYPGMPIMRATDTLYSSLTSMTSDTIWEVTPRTIQFGTNAPAFQFTQEGTANMPARPTLVLTDLAFSTLNALVLEYILDNNMQVRRV